MRESIGGLSLFQIVIVFLLLFTAIMCFTINHSRAIAVKDEVVSIIENSNLAENGELDANTINAIADRLGEVGHRSVDECNKNGETGWSGYDRLGNPNDTAALFCVKLVDVPTQLVQNAASHCSGSCYIVSPAGGTDYPYMYYYNVKLFYNLDVPVIERMSFNIVSSTKAINIKRARS